MEVSKETYKLSKTERVRNQKVLDSLFGRYAPFLIAHGFRFSWLVIEEVQPANCQVVCLASKKKLKRAVDRNYRKRLLKEFYRLNKSSLLQYLVQTETYLALSINYVGKETLDFHRFEPKFRAALELLILELKKNTHKPLTAVN